MEATVYETTQTDDNIQEEIRRINLGLICHDTPTTIIGYSSKGDELRHCKDGGEYYIIHPKDQER
jgi:hypothetical protein